MSLRYVALIRKERETEYWIDIPDLPGCVSSGENEEEAKASFQEALEMHLEAIRGSDDPVLPEPDSRDDVLANEDDPYITDYIVEVEPL